MSEWPSIARYTELRAMMADDEDWADAIEWQQNVTFPTEPDRFAQEIIWVILNSGMKSAVAQLIWDRVRPALDAGLPVYPGAFKHPGKCAAIEYIWKDRERLHTEAQSQADLVEWCGALPWIGNITKYHAAKNLGANVAKPDRWLDRIAQRSGETVDALCKRIADATTDRVATVDLVLWWACAHGPLAAELKP